MSTQWAACFRSPVPWLALALGLAALPGRAAEAIERGTLVRACDDVNEWPPFTYRDPQMPLGVGGYSVEVLSTLLARRGLRLEIELLPWRRCLDEVRQGRHWLVINGTQTKDREKHYWFSRPYYETRPHYLWSQRVHPQGLTLTGPQDLLKLRVGDVGGYVNATLMQLGMAPTSIAPSLAHLVQMLHRNRIDTVLVAEEWLRAPGTTTSPWLDPQLGHAPLQGAPSHAYSMMFSRAHPQGAALRDLVDEDLAAMERSGELQRILLHYQ